MPSPFTTLLIADDEPSVRHSLSQVLVEIGHNVRCAEDGFAALREIRSEVPEVLISDLNMPGMSGIELLSVVRRRFPTIRTIAMSNSFSGDEVPSGVAADAYYQKGSSILSLMRIMETLPQEERQAHRRTNRSATVWIHRNSHEPSQDAFVTITCPECLRTFPQTLSSGHLKRKTDCIYCGSAIRYAVVPQAERTPLPIFRLKSARGARIVRSASNLSD
ncbi:MAG: response regulator [Terracidiphilus sp.]|jgi:DNA-binding NtrC family response regulator